MMLFAALQHANDTYTLPPEKLAKAIALSHWRTGIYFGSTAWTILALWLLVRLGVGGAIRDFAARMTERRWAQGLIAAPVWLVVLTLIALPFDLLSQHVDRSFGLSVQGWAGWFGDYGKSLAITLIAGTLVLGILYLLMRRSPRRWWLWFWVLTIPIEVLVIFAVPVVIDPLFNHFTPLAQVDPALVTQLERVAARGHMEIPPSRMFVMDASSKVTGLNAYVTGFGASKRIVVWDNTIRLAAPDDILFIYGHEQGHYALHHIVLGLIFFAAVLFVAYWIAFRWMTYLIARYGQRLRIVAMDDWASLGVLFLVLTVLSFAAEPVGNAFSRWEEHQADIYGQEVIHGIVADPQQTAARSFQRLGEISLDNPSPSALVEFWTYSHPSIAHRVAFAARYDPWGPGGHPKYFPKD